MNPDEAVIAAIEARLNEPRDPCCDGGDDCDCAARAEDAHWNSVETRVDELLEARYE